MQTCAFTGHRKLESTVTKERVYQQVENLVKEGIDTFFCGLALGFDMLAGEVVLELKKNYPQIRLIGCIPFLGQESRFPKKEQLRYQTVKNGCNETVVLGEPYTPWAFHARNDYMCEHADMAFAYLTKENGGTAYTVKAFQKAGKPVVFLKME